MQLAGSSLRCMVFSLVVVHGFQSFVALGMWDLSSLTRDRTYVPCVVRQILYHWTTRKVPGFF